MRPLLTEPWILDVDTTVKPLYGRQEGAVVGYNPLKPGRPSHAYHSFMVGGVRLIWTLRRNPATATLHFRAASVGPSRPAAGGVPADAGARRQGLGNQRNMRRCEQEGVHYLFELRLTRGVRRLLEKAMGAGDWQDAGQGWWAGRRHCAWRGGAGNGG